MNDLASLRSLVAVAEAGAITEAARRLGLPQPALTRRLQQLESEFGTTLLQRGRNGATLTEAGSLLVAEARQLIERYEGAKREVARHTAATGGTIRLGGGATAVSFLLPGEIATFQSRYPNVHFQVKEGSSSDIAEDVASGRLELGLVTLPIRKTGLAIAPLQDDQIVLTTYGRSSGFCIDPIEKKPLNHFLPGTPILSFGTAGCNLTCKFCQNWDISKSREMDRLMDQASPELIAMAAKQTGCRSVAYTYNDPTIFLEYAVDVGHACHAHDLKNVAVTAGYMKPAAREDFFSVMDAANIDLKAFTESFYKTLCSAELGVVLDTLKYLKHETDVWFEITTLLIPDENDSESEVEALTQWVMENLGPDAPLHFTAFHPDYRMRDKPCSAPGASPARTASITPIPATCTTRRPAAPIAMAADCA